MCNEGLDTLDTACKVRAGLNVMEKVKEDVRKVEEVEQVHRSLLIKGDNRIGTRPTRRWEKGQLTR